MDDSMGPLVFNKGQWREMGQNLDDITYRDVGDSELLRQVKDMTDYGLTFLLRKMGFGKQLGAYFGVYT